MRFAVISLQTAANVTTAATVAAPAAIWHLSTFSSSHCVYVVYSGSLLRSSFLFMSLQNQIPNFFLFLTFFLRVIYFVCLPGVAVGVREWFAESARRKQVSLFILIHSQWKARCLCSLPCFYFFQLQLQPIRMQYKKSFGAVGLIIYS